MFGTVESAPMLMPTMEARSSNASCDAVKSKVSNFVIPGGLEPPDEVTSLLLVLLPNPLLPLLLGNRLLLEEGVEEEAALVWEGEQAKHA